MERDLEKVCTTSRFSYLSMSSSADLAPKPRIDNHLRITVGTQEEMEKLIEFLKKYLKK